MTAVLRRAADRAFAGARSLRGGAADQGIASPVPGALLVAAGIDVRYGGVRALDEVDITVEAGEIVGLIGPNGAGKTTLFECIAGFNPPRRGHVWFQGEDITRASPEERARRGLIRSFQDARLFPSLTVFQTVLVAHEKRSPSHLLTDIGSIPRTRRAERAKVEAVDALLETMGLTGYRDKLISELSTGTRRICELACVLALEPTLLLLDEPSSGIAQREVEALGELLRRIKEATGCTLLIIEHDMPLIMGLAERIVALESGRFLAEGAPAEIQANPKVIESYLGTSSETIHRSGAGPTPAPPERSPAKSRPSSKVTGAKKASKAAKTTAVDKSTKATKSSKTTKTTTKPTTTARSATTRERDARGRK